MKLLISILLLGSISMATPGQPVVTKGGYASTYLPINIQNQCYVIPGALNPTSTAVNAPACSMYLSTNGNAYIKQDAGSSTNWSQLSSGSGSFLPLAGGTMSGAINLGTNNLNNVGQIAIGQTSSAAATAIDIVNTSGSTQRIVQTGYGGFVGTRNRYANGTLGSPTAATTGNTLGFISAQGYGVSQFPAASTAALNFLAEGTFTNVSMPTAISMSVTPTGSVTSTPALVVNPTGELSLPDFYTVAGYLTNDSSGNITSTTPSATLTALSGANNQLSNLISGQTINASMSPAGVGNTDWGSTGRPFRSFYGTNVYIYDTSGDDIGSITEVSTGIKISADYAVGGTFFGPLALTTAPSSTGPTGNITLTAGTSSFATGQAGNIIIKPGLNTVNGATYSGFSQIFDGNSQAYLEVGGGGIFAFDASNNEVFTLTTGTREIDDTTGSPFITGSNVNTIQMVPQLYLNTYSGTATAVSSCGTSPTLNGLDGAGVITVGSGIVTSCTLTFGQTWSVTPHCFLNIEGVTNIAASATPTTTTMTINFSVSAGGDKIDYFCIGGT
jgi:hypothetical protein